MDIFTKIEKNHNHIQKTAVLGALTAIAKHPLKAFMGALTAKEVADHASSANKAVREAKNINRFKNITKVGP